MHKYLFIKHTIIVVLSLLIIFLVTFEIYADSEIKENSIGMKFVYIKPGMFIMGSFSSEADHYDREGPPHKVTISNGFYMQQTEVTQGMWKDVMDKNPSKFSSCGAKYPVENVSWNMVQEFIKKLNRMTAPNQYRLPTEAEWEYACRSGTTTRFSFGNNDDSLDKYAWYRLNTWVKDEKRGRTHPVAQKNPNAWGLFDMHGNVWEWCQDWYGDYSLGAITNPEGLSSRSCRVLRGGSFFSFPKHCRSAYRGYENPDERHGASGFRLVLLPSQ